MWIKPSNLLWSLVESLLQKNMAAWTSHRKRKRGAKPKSNLKFIFLPSLVFMCIFLIYSSQRSLQALPDIEFGVNNDNAIADIVSKNISARYTSIRNAETSSESPFSPDSSEEAETPEIIDDTNINTHSNEKDELSKVASAIDCQLEMEEYLRPRIYQWVMAKVPIPMNVKIIQDQYYVIFNTGYIPPKIWYGATFRCNGNDPSDDNDEHLEDATILPVTKPGESSLIIRCPRSLHPDKTQLDTVSVSVVSPTNEDENEGEDTNRNHTTIYEMDRFTECEYLDQDEFSPPNTSIGLCTSIAGKESVRKLAYQWAEYHRLIGVDHTWIYINSDYDDGKHLPTRPYISWIPYNYNIKAYNFTDRPWTQRSEFFRLTSQVECILRARRMGMDWIIFTDIDEYLQIVEDGNVNKEDVTTANANDGAHSSRPVLKRFLDTYQSNRTEIGSLVMNSIPFGHNFEDDENNDEVPKPLLMDHIWRNKQNPKDYTWSRWKQIVNPQNVHNYAIHWLGGGDVMKEIRLDADKVRINHYKDVYKQIKKGSGVFGTEDAKDLVQDKLLVEQFHDGVLEAVKSDVRVR